MDSFCWLYVFNPVVLLQELILEVNELRYRLQEMESDRIQYEKKLKSTKVSPWGVLWPA